MLSFPSTPFPSPAFSELHKDTVPSFSVNPMQVGGSITLGQI